MHIKIYGPGCPKCQQTFNLIEACIKDSCIEATVEKISDLVQIYQAGIVSTPAVVIDDVLVCSGEVPKASTVMQWLKPSCSCCQQNQ